MTLDRYTSLFEQEKKYRYTAGLISRDKYGSDIVEIPIKEYKDIEKFYRGLEKDFGIRNAEKNIAPLLKFDDLGYAAHIVFPHKSKITGNPIKLRVVRLRKR